MLAIPSFGCRCLVASVIAGALGAYGMIVPLHAQSATEGTPDSVATVTYRVPLSGRTPDQAKRLALERAQAEAVRRVVGTDVQAQRQSMTIESGEEMVDRFSQVVRTGTSGRVVDYKLLQTGVTEHQGQPYYRVEMQATVGATEGERDPAFRIEELSLNQEDGVFVAREGRTTSDEVIVNIEVSKDAYLTLFNITPDTLQVIWPNAKLTDTYVPAHTPVQFPPPEWRERGLRLRAWPMPEDKQEVLWRLFAVATKEKIPFPADTPAYTGEGTLPTPKASIQALNRWLVQIPLDRRVTASVAYSVHRSQ